MATYNQPVVIEAIGARRVSPVTAVDLSMDASAGGEFAPMPLDQRLLEASADASVMLKGDRMQVMANLENNPGSVTSPEQLFEVQQRLGDYALQVSLLSGVTRKGVAAVETLLRA